MVQFSLRLSDDVHRRARLAADASGMSLNGFIARVLQVATDPASTEPEADRIRARLAAAGLIDSPRAAGQARSPEEQAHLESARARSRTGGPAASELVSQERAGGR